VGKQIFQYCNSNFVIFCLTLLASTMAYAQVTAGPNSPPGVPDWYLITPFGYFHPSCVRQLAEGETLLAGGSVIQHADGTFDNVPACGYPHYTARGEVVVAGAARAEPPTISHSWIVDGRATTSTAYGQISVTWTVPPAPTSKDGQTVYFFPGFEDIKDVESILQPVLGWNADFSKAWGIASWNCCIKGVTWESTPKPVTSGDAILGTVASTCGAGKLTCPLWNVITRDKTSGKSTKLPNTPSKGQTFNLAFGGVLEVYNVARCSDYPPSGSLAFNVALYDDDFLQISNPGWSISDDAKGLTPQCNYGGNVAAKQVKLHWIGAPTYFLSGNWEGSATVVDGTATNKYSVGASISQTTTLFTATLTVLGPGNVPLIYTVKGQIRGSSISFSNSGDADGSATGTISPNGRKVSGSGSDGSTGTMTWDGGQTLTGTASLADGDTWTGTASTDGQNLTGRAKSPTGDSVSWTMQRVQ
jgi:hypothetical protein